MECVYINLDASAARRRNLEASFSTHRKDGWRLTRFPAISVDHLASNPVPGPLSAREKACFLSHRQVMADHSAGPAPVFILEDDATFGTQTCEAIDRFLRDNPQLDWDVLFTDICVPDVATMVNLIKVRHRLTSEHRVSLLNLNQMSFAGATAYLVNGRSKRKLSALLASATSLDLPYDLLLRQLIHQRQINGYCFFPFITSLSADSESSQIQDAGTQSTDLIWNTYRKMIWTDRDLAGLSHTLNDIDLKLCDDESRAFGILFAAMSSTRFALK